MIQRLHGHKRDWQVVGGTRGCIKKPRLFGGNL
jgi:hypothetical protein